MSRIRLLTLTLVLNSLSQLIASSPLNKGQCHAGSTGMAIRSPREQLHDWDRALTTYQTDRFHHPG